MPLSGSGRSEGFVLKFPNLPVVLSVAVFCALLVPPRAVAQTDLQTITTRYTAQLISEDPSDSTVEGYMSTLESNGSWPDINYSNTAQTNWTPATHLTRMDSMAESYNNPSSSLYHSASLATDLSDAFNYWISANPMSTNWYDNDIRAPQDLGDDMVLMDSLLNSTQLSEGNTILNRARSELSVPSIAQGSNLVLLSQVGIDQGIIDSNTSYLSTGFSGIASTVVVVSPQSGDGFQTDGSYNFHGTQLYMGDYGLTALQDPLDYASLAVGTAYSFSSAQEQILVNGLINGSQWAVYGQSLEFSASGRDASREGFDTVGNEYGSAVQYALDLGSYDQSQLQAFLNRQNGAINTGSASPSLQLVGNRGFYDSDFMVEQQPGFFAAVKVTSTRTTNPESINGENLKGLYLGDGVNEILVTGNEYNNIEPVWDWERLPGTTVQQNPSQSLQPGSADHGSTNFAGGVSDGNYGDEALEYNRFNVAADKSWYFFQNEEVALGTAINAPNAAQEVDTTLNQCLLTSTVTYQTTGSSSPQTLTSGTVTPSGLEWVYQGGVGYFFPTPANNATIEAVSQSGNWQAINSQYSNATISSNVFTLYLDHGANTLNGAYEYVVVPDTTATGIAAYAASAPIKVLSNNSDVQAVQQTAQDITQAVFYEPGSFSITTGQTVSASAASTIMLNRQPDVMELCAASPQNLQMSMQVQLSGVTLSGSSSTWFDSMGTATATFNLPGGGAAGSTIGLTLSSNGASTPTVSLSNTVGSALLTYTVSEPVALPNNTTFQTDANSSLNFSAAISGPASLSTSGSGTITFSGNNSYNGGTNVFGGTLIVNSGSNLGTSGTGLVLGTPVPATNGGTTATGNLTLDASVAVNSFSSTSNNATADVLTISPGITLTDTGPFTVGGINSNTSAIVYNGALTLTGGGSLVVSGSANFLVAQPSNNTGGKDTTTVDLSGLNSVNINTTGTFAVGLGANSRGILTLADSNLSGASSSSNFINANEIDIGNSQFNNDAGMSILNLGSGTNVLQASTINLGFGKTGGQVTWVADATANSSVAIAGTGGGNALANITLGQANAATYTSGRLTQLLLAGHKAMVQAGALVIGDSTGNSANGPNASVTFDTGTFSAQSVTIAADTGGTSTVGPSGSLTIGGASPNDSATGIFTIGSAASPGTFLLGDFTGSAAATATASLTINSGVVNCFAPIVVASPGGTTDSSLTLAGNGVLNMEGNAIGGNGAAESENAPITTVSLAPAATDTPVLENLGGTGINGNGLAMNGLGTLILAGKTSYTGPTTVSNGTLQLAAGSGATSFSSLSIPEGKFDITNNPVIINYGSAADPIASIAGYLATGYNGGLWTGAGIASSTVASDDATQSALVYAIGYADGADGLTGVPAGEIEILPTLAGDAKLQGNVVFGDYQLLAEYFGQSGGWDEGNFTYGPTIDFADFQLLAQDFGDSSGLTAGELASLNQFAGQFNDALIANSDGIGFHLVSVPEPASVGIFGLVAIGILSRRRSIS
jgi:autotransporter-associated beta strand protein